MRQHLEPRLEAACASSGDVIRSANVPLYTRRPLCG